MNLTINPTTSLWTFEAGDSSNFASPSYGVKGVPNPNNYPGGRHSSTIWKDKQDNIWLFGGISNSNYFIPGNTNDLWKLNKSTGAWTWMGGSDLINQFGVYGVKGVPSSANRPGARHEAQSWIDTSGRLWLFGGVGFGSTSAYGELNDLWCYNPSTGLWTWIFGDNLPTIAGNWGIMNVPSSLNKPSARRGAVTWVHDGNLFMFGGTGMSGGLYGGNLNDIWRFNIATSTWTWVGGTKQANQPGSYGSQGIASSSNIPGGRRNASLCNDDIGNIWIYGGIGQGSTYNIYNEGLLNDLWKYNTSSGLWTWVSGSDTFNCKGKYKVKGISSSLNVPSAKSYSGLWYDNSGSIILYAGLNTQTESNDAWKYSIVNNNWAWVSGDSAGIQQANYGIKKYTSLTNFPGKKYAFGYWKDSLNKFWVFGGEGLDSSNSDQKLNSLWVFNPANCINPLELKLFIQGYYNGSNSMNSALFNQGRSNYLFITDTIEVELHHPVTPYNKVTSTKSLLLTNGTATCIFENNPGSYYIVIKHRNGIETWSAQPIEINSNGTVYDFTNNATSSYGNNSIEVSPSVWSIPSGDLNQDENIDLLDMSDLEFLINGFNFGYYPQDLNGDGNVDLLDAPILESNINNFIFSNHP